MLTTIGQNAMLRAWIDPPYRSVDPAGDDAPDLTLILLSDRGDALVVEVLEGAPCPSGTTLWIDERGSFQVAGVLSREGFGASRTYMRLRASPSPVAA